MATFQCVKCGQEKQVQESGGTGYAEDKDGGKICYACMADIDREAMVKDGKATLYLTCEPARNMFLHGRPFTIGTLTQGHGRKTAGTVGNWPGTLTFPCNTRVGNHNIARWRYDVWFRGPDGYTWHGVTYGDNTQICHCRRTKERA